MGKFDFEIQPAPEPPDPDADRAPVERTPLQNSVTWLTLVPILIAALFVFACGSKRIVDAGAEITRVEELGRRATASIEPLIADLKFWGHQPTVLEADWRAQQATRLDALRRHESSARLLMLLGIAAFVPALVVWSRGQFGRPEGAGRIDKAQVGLAALTVAILAAGWTWDGRALDAARRHRPTVDLGHQAAAIVAEAREERLVPWRQVLNEALAALRPPLDPDANYWCPADTVRQCMAAPEFEMVDGTERARLRLALETLSRPHFRTAAFDPLTRARRPFIGEQAVAALLAEQERETKVFADDTEKAEYLFDAVRRDDAAAVRMVCRRGFDLNVVKPGPDGGYTPLFAAVSERRPVLVRLLLENGARPDIARDPARSPGRSGDFPLHAAVGEPRLVRLLLEHGANPNVRNTAGFAPLHVAALAGDRSSIRVLATRRADLNAPDACGQTPLDLANDPHASEPARGASSLLHQLGCLTSTDLN